MSRSLILGPVSCQTAADAISLRHRQRRSVIGGRHLEQCELFWPAVSSRQIGGALDFLDLGGKFPLALEPGRELFRFILPTSGDDPDRTSFRDRDVEIRSIFLDAKPKHGLQLRLAAPKEGHRRGIGLNMLRGAIDERSNCITETSGGSKNLAMIGNDCAEHGRRSND